MTAADINGVTIEYDVRGSGEPILFIMGLGCQLTDWRTEFVDLFVDEGYKVIRFDNRDAGLSSKDSWEVPSQLKAAAFYLARRELPEVGYTLTDMANDAAGLLDHLGIPSAHVVGASMGGMIAQELAIEHPDKVRSLCSIMSNTGDRKNGRVAAGVIAKLGRLRQSGPDDPLAYSMEMWKLFAGPEYDPEVYRQHLSESVARNWSPDAVDRQTAAIAGSRDRTELLGSVTAPTLVVHGLVDQLVLPSGGVATARAVPGARLLCFPDMAHDLPQARWLELRKAMIQNFARATTPAAQAPAPAFG